MLWASNGWTDECTLRNDRLGQITFVPPPCRCSEFLHRWAVTTLTVATLQDFLCNVCWILYRETLQQLSDALLKNSLLSPRWDVLTLPDHRCHGGNFPVRTWVTPRTLLQWFLSSSPLWIISPHLYLPPLLNPICCYLDIKTPVPHFFSHISPISASGTSHSGVRGMLSGSYSSDPCTPCEMERD